MGALAWAEIRRRWLGAAVVGLVLGVGFAAVLAAAVGARRTETAFPRMLVATATSELLVSADHEDPAVRRRLYGEVGGLAGVEATGLVVGVDLVPAEVPKGAGTTIEACAMAPLDGGFGDRIDRPNVLEGRLPSPDRVDEIAVTDSYARTFGVGVGDDLDLVVHAGDGRTAGEPTAADGPVVHATIVGIGVTASEIVPVSDLDAAPQVIPSRALAERYAQEDEEQCYDAVAVKLTRGTDVGRAAADIRSVLDRSGNAFILDRTASFAEVRRSIQPQVTALWLFAGAAAVATALVVAQVLGRQLRQEASASAPVWRAVGITRAQGRVLVSVPSLVTAVVGGGVALAAAVVVSDRFPIGPARLAETDPGLQLHAWLHVGGAAAVVLLALLIGAVASLLGTPARPRPARLGWLARAGSSASRPAVVVGLHLATGSGRGRSAVPVRSAAAGVALAVAAVFATVTCATGLSDLVSVPERYGRDWDVMVDGEFQPAPVASLLEQLGGHPAVAAIAGGRYGETTVDGVQVPTVGLTDLTGTTFPAVIDGRAPARSDEIVLGRRSLRSLGKSVGATVSVDTGGGPQEMTVVGTAAFPRLNHGSFSALGLGVGAMTRSGAFPPFEVDLADVPPGIDPDDFFVGPDRTLFEFATVRLHPASSAEDRREAMDVIAGIAGANQQIVRLEQRPTAIDNYAAVRSTPVVLAVLLGAMAAATLGHLVVSVVRRRRRDLALCAALGMRRSQILGSVVIQSLLVAGVALLVGLPLGLAAGRTAWSGFAADLGVVDTLRLPVVAVAVAVAVVVGGAALIATIPALVAARAGPAQALRTE